MAASGDCPCYSNKRKAKQLEISTQILTKGVGTSGSLASSCPRRKRRRRNHRRSSLQRRSPPLNQRSPPPRGLQRKQQRKSQQQRNLRLWNQQQRSPQLKNPPRNPRQRSPLRSLPPRKRRRSEVRQFFNKQNGSFRSHYMQKSNDQQCRQNTRHIYSFDFIFIFNT